MKSAQYSEHAGINADVDAAVGGAGKLMGFSARESAGTSAAAALDIVDGATADGGNHIVNAEFKGDDSVTQWFGPDGIRLKNGGLSINVVSGTMDITLYYK